MPVGATVEAAYLYTSTYGYSIGSAGGSFESNPITYTPLGLNVSAGGLEAGRADVTSIVAPIVNGGPGGTYSFSITETSGNQDGSALVVVYRLSSLPVSTVAIQDGFSDAAGDKTTLDLASPINLSTPGFFAEMRLGIGFSCCNQTSQVTVNGTIITTNAGNNDDSADMSLGNGNLITVGGNNDPFSPMTPSYGDDHERYNLIPQLSNGDMSIEVDTVNPSRNDNIFLAVFYMYGQASTTGPIQPSFNATVKPVPFTSLTTITIVSLLLTVFGAMTIARQRNNT